MPRFFVVTRREARDAGASPERLVGDVPGLSVLGGSNPDRIVVDGSEEDAERLRALHGDQVLVEPEILHHHG